MKCNYVERLVPDPLQAQAQSAHFCCSQYNTVEAVMPRRALIQKIQADLPKTVQSTKQYMINICVWYNIIKLYSHTQL
jgi:hypothetical protein